MTHARTMLLALSFGVSGVVPQGLSAQRRSQGRPIELGVDATLAYESGDRVKSTALSIPVGRFRAGFFLSDAVSFEPAFSIQYRHSTIESPTTGDDITISGTTYDFDFGLLFHFSPDRTQSQTYIRPFVGLRGFSGDDDSGSQGSFGLGLGVKKPIVNRLAGRLEVGFAHATDDDSFPASNQVFFAFGLSFFTR